MEDVLAGEKFMPIGTRYLTMMRGTKGLICLQDIRAFVKRIDNVPGEVHACYATVTLYCWSKFAFLEQGRLAVGSVLGAGDLPVSCNILFNLYKQMLRCLVTLEHGWERSDTTFQCDRKPYSRLMPDDIKQAAR